MNDNSNALGQKVLLTGANGRLGRFLIDHLQNDGFAVIAAARQCPAIDNVHANIAVGDFHADMDWDDATKGVSSVVHLAALTWNGGADDEQYRIVNVAATLALAKSAHKAGAKRLVYISSATVNGKVSGAEPFRADGPPRPGSAYSRSKLEAETELLEFGKVSGLEIVILRPPLIVWPEPSGNMARLSRFIERGIPLPFGAVTDNRRDKLSPINLFQAIRLALTVDRAAGERFMVSDGEPHSTRDLMVKLGRATGSKPRLLPVPVPVLRLLIKSVPEKFLGRLSREEMAMELLGNLEIDTAKTKDILGYKPVSGPSV